MAVSTSLRRSGARTRLPAPARRARRRGRWPLTTLLAVAWLVGISVAAIAAPLLPLPDPATQDLLARLQPPAGFGGTLAHPLGTDQLGRDLASRILAGTRVSLALALVGVVISAVVGTILGIVAGYRRGLLDQAISVLIDVQLAVPFIVLALVALTLFGTGLVVLIILLGLSGWEQYARIARANTLRLRNELFVVAARAVGASPARILLRHILPNEVAPLLVLMTLHLTSLVLLESSLSFLGIGVQPPTPSLGNILGDARNYLQIAWWLPVFPGAVLLAITLSFNEVGDWLRDVTDPTTRRW